MRKYLLVLWIIGICSIGVTSQTVKVSASWTGSKLYELLNSFTNTSPGNMTTLELEQWARDQSSISSYLLGVFDAFSLLGHPLKEQVTGTMLLSSQFLTKTYIEKHPESLNQPAAYVIYQALGGDSGWENPAQ